MRHGSSRRRSHSSRYHGRGAGGHEVVAASPKGGVNTVTGEGLKEAMAGAQVVIDLSNAPSLDAKAVLEFFETSGRNLLAAESAASVRHHVALSIVGTDRVPDQGYFRAKVAGVREAVEQGGARLLYLPPYSPDLSPIEPCWSKLKTVLRTAQARTCEALEQAITQALATITVSDARHWFHHCGYTLQ